MSRPANESDHRVAETIVAQLGGHGLLRAMLGAQFYVKADGLSVNLRASAHRRINRIEVTLMPADDYLVEFWSVSGRAGRCSRVVSCSGVQVSELRSTVERTTGLALSLNSVPAPRVAC